MEQVVASHGLQLRYVPEAIVWNRGAENLPDFIRRRVSNHRGHMSLASNTGYRPSSVGLLTSLAAASMLWRRRRAALKYILATAVTEAMARAVARISRVMGREPNGLWRRITTSNSVAADGEVAEALGNPPEPSDGVGGRTQVAAL